MIERTKGRDEKVCFQVVSHGQDRDLPLGKTDGMESTLAQYVV